MGISTPGGGGGAPTDAAYVTGSSNSELSNETVISPAGDILTSGSFGSTVSLSPGFGTYTQVSADHPSLLFGEFFVDTDGNNNATIDMQIDESGGTTATYELRVATVSEQLSAGTSANQTVTIPLPAGAQFKVLNTKDPNGINQILVLRAVVITP